MDQLPGRMQPERAAREEGSRVERCTDWSLGQSCGGDVNEGVNGFMR
jgi:hypothetical protein